IGAARAAIAARTGAVGKNEALAGKLRTVGARVDEAKKKIVATKEGGAITGEERIREHLDLLYGALLSWEGRPARYQVERIDALAHELRDVGAEFDALVEREIKPLDEPLRSLGLEPIPTRPSPGTALRTGEPGS